jgi:tRNA (cmo5U34)-methyltransferase
VSVNYANAEKMPDKDRIYEHHDAGPGSFEFNSAVADVFPDMLRRSIPGYDASLTAIEALARRHVTAGSRCYDLGCSLGAATLAMRHGIVAGDCEIVAADLAPAMVERCREIVAADDGATPVAVVERDVREVPIDNASMVVMNYTLQFIDRADRSDLVRRIAAGMTPGGVFVLSEKVAHEDPAIDALLVELHHDFKRANAYSDLEIARKRAAIENVLVPESTETHIARLRDAGFRHCDVWMKHLNFVSFVAIR